MKKSKKGYVPIMVKPDTKQMVKDLMPAYEDTYDETVKMLIRNSAELRDAKQEIERLKKELRNNLGMLKPADFGETKDRLKKEYGLHNGGK